MKGRHVFSSDTGDTTDSDRCIHVVTCYNHTVTEWQGPRAGVRAPVSWEGRCLWRNRHDFGDNLSSEEKSLNKTQVRGLCGCKCMEVTLLSLSLDMSKLEALIWVSIYRFNVLPHDWKFMMSADRLELIKKEYRHCFHWLNKHSVRPVPNTAAESLQL